VLVRLLGGATSMATCSCPVSLVLGVGMCVSFLVLVAAASASAFAPTASFAPRSMALQKPALRAAPRAGALSLQAKDGFEITEGTPFDLNPGVLGISFLGWAIPGLLPSNIPLYGGKGLTTALFAEIGEHLQSFPAPPPMSDPFWVILFIWHSGLFATMIFGTIGYNGYGKNSDTKY